MNECPKDTELVLYAAGDLDAASQEALAAHLVACEACRAEVAALGRGLEALALLERGPALPPAAAERIERRLEAEAKPLRAERGRRPWIVRLRPYVRQALAAAAVLVLAVGAWLITLPPADRVEPEATDEAILAYAVDLALLELDDEADEATPALEALPEWDDEALEEIELLLEMMTDEGV